MSLRDAASKGVKVTMKIPPDERNRAACVVWESEMEVGSHCLESDELAGGIPTKEFYIKLHTPGEFAFQAILEATDHRYTTALQSVEVN